MLLAVSPSACFTFYTGLSLKKKKKQAKPDIVIHGYERLLTARILDETQVQVLSGSIFNLKTHTTAVASESGELHKNIYLEEDLAINGNAKGKNQNKAIVGDAMEEEVKTAVSMKS